MGHGVSMLTPECFATVGCPSYDEIRLALPRPRRFGRLVDGAMPQAIHIATEGPLGLMMRRLCRQRRYPFTTSFHTRFPEYVHARWSVPLRWSYRFLRWFHSAASRTMVSTPSVESSLQSWGFTRLSRWSRGVDTQLFRPRDKDFFPYPRPISLYVGRVAVEKSVEDFLRLELPGTKVVVGDGPQLPELKARYPSTVFTGAKRGEELARHFAAADVFVFPSRTDTFGLVLLEALASGVPVAAYPVSGPQDVVGDAPVGCLHEDLHTAIARALAIPPERCEAFAQGYSWDSSARQFLGNLHVFR